MANPSETEKYEVLEKIGREPTCNLLQQQLIVKQVMGRSVSSTRFEGCLIPR